MSARTEQPTRTHRGTEYPVSHAHPAANVLPWLPEDELQALADDIAANGQEYGIVRLPDGRVVDGRNRELACRVAGVEPTYRDEDMTDDEVIDLVVSRNIHRRNLTASQRAMIAAELANLRKGQHKNEIGTGAYLASEALENKASQADAAQMLDVSPRSVRSAAKVKNQAPELVEAVRQGDLDVKTAAKVADLPARDRKKVARAADPKEAARKVLDRAKDGAEPAGPTLHVADQESAADEGVEFVAGVEALCRDVDQVAARMKALKASRFGYSMHVDSAVAQVEAARKTLWQGRPAHRCPYCKGDGCKVCNGTGRVKKATFDAGVEAVGDAA